MMLMALLGVPAAAAVVSFFLRPHGARRVLLLAAASVHTGLVVLLWIEPGFFPAVGSWIAVDALGRLFLGITSVLFLAVAWAAVGFLRGESAAASTDPGEGFLFRNIPEAVFTACLLGFLATMTLVTISRHFGLIWVAIEATTLVSAPLIHYHRHHRSLEATWKYLLLCSVGIAVALLGTYFLAASLPGDGATVALTVDSLTAAASRLDPRWLKAAFIMLLVGYGTKMGLAPMHSWLPDAHSESPSVVSALLSGALLNCAFLAILRILAVCSGAGLGEFARQTVLVLGLVSMGVAAGFILGQADYKRLLAYSSVEHMGILAVGVGLGGLGDWGALFHAVNHSLIKAALFLAAGSILAAYKTKSCAEVRGVARRLPVTGVVWVAGLFAVAGSPPFGAFTSELTILRAAVERGAWVAAAIYCLFLVVVFAGIVSIMVRMAQGAPVAAPGAPAPLTHRREGILAVAPPLVLVAATTVLGLFIPGFLDATLRQAAALLGG
jgi:hydrogenase-4 component F